MCIFIGCGEQTLWRDANECDVERKQMTTLIKHGEECSNRMKYLIQWTIYTMLLFTQILTTIFDSETDVQQRLLRSFQSDNNERLTGRQSVHVNHNLAAVQSSLAGTIDFP